MDFDGCGLRADRDAVVSLSDGAGTIVLPRIRDGFDRLGVRYPCVRR